MEPIIVGSFVDNNIVTRPHPWMSIIADRKSDSGVLVDEQTALSHTPLWHGLNLLGGDVGSLPLEQLEIKGDQKIQVRNHTAYKMAAIRPHSLMSPNAFWEMMIVRAILWGNALCEIPRANSGRPLPIESGGGLLPLSPSGTRPEYDSSGKLWISTRYLDEKNQLQDRRIDPIDTLHLTNLSTDGFWGKGLLDVGKNRIGAGLGIEKSQNRFLNNGMRPDWLFTFPLDMEEEELQAFEERLEKRNKGLMNTGNSLVMDNSGGAQQLGMNFDNAQFVELMQFDTIAISSLLCIPAIMLNAMSKMTFNNTEESERWYINRTLRRWLNKIHEELAWKLLTERERPRYVFQHNLRPLLRGRLQERYAAYSQAIASMWMNPNEAREEEGMNPVDGLDEFKNPNTTSPAEKPDEETANLTAQKLKRVLAKEDHDLAEACRNQKNILDWMDQYYRGEMLETLFQITPKTAGQYCNSRFHLMRKFADHVSTTTKLGELIKAQNQTQSDRIAGLLNAELNHAISS